MEDYIQYKRDNKAVFILAFEGKLCLPPEEIGGNFVQVKFCLQLTKEKCNNSFPFL